MCIRMLIVYQRCRTTGSPGQYIRKLHRQQLAAPSRFEHGTQSLLLQIFTLHRLSTWIDVVANPSGGIDLRWGRRTTCLQYQCKFIVMKSPGQLRKASSESSSPISATLAAYACSTVPVSPFQVQLEPLLHANSSISAPLVISSI